MLVLGAASIECFSLGCHSFFLIDNGAAFGIGLGAKGVGMRELEKGTQGGTAVNLLAEAVR